MRRGAGEPGGKKGKGDGAAVWAQRAKGCVKGGAPPSFAFNHRIWKARREVARPRQGGFSAFLSPENAGWGTQAGEAGKVATVLTQKNRLMQLPQGDARLRDNKIPIDTR